MNSFYYIGHFSRFIRPGAKRIVSSSNTDDLLSTAFINPDGKIAVVVFNQTDSLNFEKSTLYLRSCFLKQYILKHHEKNIPAISKEKKK